MRDAFIHPIPESTIVACVTKVGKVFSRFQTETGQKPYPLIPQGEEAAAFYAVFQPCVGCQEGNPDFVPHSFFSSTGSDEKDSFIHNHSNTRLGFLVWNQVVASCSIFSLLYHLSDSAAKAARKVLRRAWARRGKFMIESAWWLFPPLSLVLSGKTNYNLYWVILAGIALKPGFNPCPSSPSVATDDRKQFQCLNIILNF